MGRFWISWKFVFGKVQAKLGEKKRNARQMNAMQHIEQGTFWGIIHLHGRGGWGQKIHKNTIIRK